jgi:hypothetical protein
MHTNVVEWKRDIYPQKNKKNLRFMLWNADIMFELSNNGRQPINVEKKKRNDQCAIKWYVNTSAISLREQVIC